MLRLLRPFAVVVLLVPVCLSAAADKKGPPKLGLSQAEQRILELTNQAREKEKLPPLRPNPVLFQLARDHSANMAKHGQMSHELDGKNLQDRMTAAGYAYRWIGENVAYSSPLDVEGTFERWMKSEHHRANILQKEAEEIGIGVAFRGQNEVYYTQVFGSPRKP